jgi:hypothetical protein
VRAGYPREVPCFDLLVTSDFLFFLVLSWDKFLTAVSDSSVLALRSGVFAAERVPSPVRSSVQSLLHEFFLRVHSLPAIGRTVRLDSVSRAGLRVGLVRRKVLVLSLSFSATEIFFGRFAVSSDASRQERASSDPGPRVEPTFAAGARLARTHPNRRLRFASVLGPRPRIPRLVPSSLCLFLSAPGPSVLDLAPARFSYR